MPSNFPNFTWQRIQVQFVQSTRRAVFLAAWIGGLTTGATSLLAGGEWTDLTGFLVPSNGSRQNDGKVRDTGSMIVFFDPEAGDNATGALYWWDGQQIVDSSGSPTNGEGEAYGSDPLEPNENAIAPFAHLVNQPRLRLMAGYADWFLFRRGATHQTFEFGLVGGRSITAPMVVAAYGPLEEGRAIIDPISKNPFGDHTGGATVVQFHQVLSGLLLHQELRHLGMHSNCTSPGAPGVPTWLIEDCKIDSAQMNYLPVATTMRRSVSAFNWSADSHSQAYFTSDFHAAPTFDEVVLYKNGYKVEPRGVPDPERTIFDRNIYQGGGAQLGHTYRNIISADGGSGGPQMRLGALIEDSLMVEGYWFSGTSSNKSVNPWMIASGQRGCSAIVRNNVQFIHKYPSPRDPDTDATSQPQAQPGWGYTVQGASFGARIENNIVSGAMLTDELGFDEHDAGFGFKFSPTAAVFDDGNTYTSQRCTMRDNICYRTKTGLNLGEDWTGAAGHFASGNVFVSNEAFGVSGSNIGSADQLTVQDNRFYTNVAIPAYGWVGAGNTGGSYANAAASEGWPDPNRTVKRYVLEVLGLTLLDWADDPWLDPAAVAIRVAANEAYDPTGLKTFMAVAINMRRGGVDPVPASGKPSWLGDYPWDTRFTGRAVVNWIRAGFGLPPTGPSENPRAFVYEGFKYTGGSQLSGLHGGIGWAGGWAGAGHAISATGLAHPLLHAAGQAADLTANGITVRPLDLTGGLSAHVEASPAVTAGGELWFAVLARASGVEVGTSGFGFYLGATQTLWIHTGTAGDWMLDDRRLGPRSGTNADLIVLRFNLTDLPGGDWLTAYYNPAPGVLPSGGVVLSGLDIEFDSLAIERSSVMGISFDEIRLGPTYETVAPTGPAGTFGSWATAYGIGGQPSNGDFDGDGLDNLIEYALGGLDPARRDGFPGNFDGTTLTFNKNPEAIENGDVTWIIEQSTDLGFADPWKAVITHGPDNSDSTITYTFPVGAPANFARIKVASLETPPEAGP